MCLKRVQWITKAAEVMFIPPSERKNVSFMFGATSLTITALLSKQLSHFTTTQMVDLPDGVYLCY